MNRSLFISAFLLGAGAVIWMAGTFIGSDKLALTVTLVIGCVYLIGFVELVQFRQATATLTTALSPIPGSASESMEGLNQWLGKLHPSLQNSVRLRVEGERVGLPAPVITPYLVGLLVMLGLLGTFVGMVETLRGAVFALEGTTELQAIRAGLAAPINGLSLAFGTSVAGVAASAMLGLISTLSRRDRILATRHLDTAVATVFRGFSLAHHRQETYKALQSQAQALPAVAQQLQELAEKIAHMGTSLGDKLIANQAQFHESVQGSYTALASSVDASLKQSLSESGRLAGDSIKPLLSEAMAAISEQAQSSHQHMSNTAQQQLEAMGKQVEQMSAAMLESFNSNSLSWLERQEAGHEQRLERMDTLAASVSAGLDKLRGEEEQREQAALARIDTLVAALSSGLATLRQEEEQRDQSALSRMDTLIASLTTGIATLRQDEEQRGQAAVERMAGLESTVATHLARLGKELETPMTRLIETASETPRAAAEVIGQLRKEISNTIERDNQLLQERAQVMGQLNALALTLEQASSSQRDAVEQLVSSSSELLQGAGSRFVEQVDTELANVSDIVANFSGSAAEMASLGESFGLAVTLFNESNSQLIESLARIETSMANSSSRSDEQMGYYVAQAREILDQSLLSQREVFEELQQLGDRQLAAEAS